MKDIGTDDTRVGTACTFTGRGAWQGSARRRVLAAALAAMGLLGIGAGYFLIRPSGPALPPGPREAKNIPADDMAVPPAISGRPMPSLPPVSPLPRAGQSRNEPAQPHRSAGAPPDPALQDRRAAGAAQPGGPASAPGAAARSTAAAAVPARSRFHVQAGSFADRENAVSLLMQLRGRGYAARLIDRAPYRVWVGGYIDRPTAERLASALRADGFESTLTPR